MSDVLICWFLSHSPLAAPWIFSCLAPFSRGAVCSSPVLFHQLGLSKVLRWVKLGLLDNRQVITMKVCMAPAATQHNSSTSSSRLATTATRTGTASSQVQHQARMPSACAETAPSPVFELRRMRCCLCLSVRGGSCSQTMAG
jgi:hypothetical protein